MQFARLIIIALIVFELLNFAGILAIPLEFSWLGLIVTSGFSLIVLEILNIFSLMSPAGYILSAAGLWLDALGDIAGLYGQYWFYDQFMHFLGGAIIMAIALTFINRGIALNNLRTPLLFVILAGLAFVGLFGSLYEIEEYLEDRFWHGRQLRLGDGPDTADDLMLDLFGGAAFGTLYFVSKKAVNRLQ
ncbi:hypothetical protein HYW53_02110 [Candidatus Giovannonibacteria bacterium]|nr:hypothetical protein [Candidatus Giovannonibacteria bacterium]